MALAALCLGGGAGASYALRGVAFRLAHPPRNVVVGARSAPAYGNAEAWLAKLPERAFLDDVLLSTGADHIVVPAPELGFALDVDRTLTRIELASASVGWFQQLKRAMIPTPFVERIEPAFMLDQQTARRRLEALAPGFARLPQNAELDVVRHRRIDDVPGRELDVDASLARLEQRQNDAVELAFREIPARVRSEDLLQIDVSLVLSTFETDFRKKAGQRALNIRRAAALLDGALIGPGEKLSFNAKVGDRTEHNGFVWAPVIVNDEMEPGVGGGVCQVATTLHAAAVLGGLSVPARRSHSRPSGYAPLGLDATVIYGEVDLVIENPYPAPILVHAFLPSEFIIRVELLGAKRGSSIEHSYAVIERHDFYRRIIEDETLTAGQFKLKQDGGFGYDVVSMVKTTELDGTDSVRRYSSKYYPVPEVYAVGPGTPSSALPELPEGATHAELAQLHEELFSEL
jgi:vancomycin resistance protein YoaR